MKSGYVDVQQTLKDFEESIAPEVIGKARQLLLKEHDSKLPQELPLAQISRAIRNARASLYGDLSDDQKRENFEARQQAMLTPFSSYP